MTASAKDPLFNFDAFSSGQTFVCGMNGQCGFQSTVSNLTEYLLLVSVMLLTISIFSSPSSFFLQKDKSQDLFSSSSLGSLIIMNPWTLDFDQKEKACASLMSSNTQVVGSSASPAAIVIAAGDQGARTWVRGKEPSTIKESRAKKMTIGEESFHEVGSSLVE